MEQMAAALTEIVESIKRVTAIVSDIAAASAEQAVVRQCNGLAVHNAPAATSDSFAAFAGI
jgi:methyl-accepting chemotaxis protein